MTHHAERVRFSQIAALPIPRITFNTPPAERTRLVDEAHTLYDTNDTDALLSFIDTRIAENQTDVIHDLLAYLAQQIIDLDAARRQLEPEIDLFRLVDLQTPCRELGKILYAALDAGDLVQDLPCHDIEALRLRPADGAGRWILSAYVRLRDLDNPRQYQQDDNGQPIRTWTPIYNLPLDETTGNFYRHALDRLSGFVHTGKFPGGYTRSVAEKVRETKIPLFQPVDLSTLDALKSRASEIENNIETAERLIDQITYNLYGLTGDEIAVVEGVRD
jgi:hypothetical protein